MSNELDDLKAAMTAETPAPDAARKAANLAFAQKVFAARQGSQNEARPMSDRPRWGLLTGVRTMFHSLSLKGALAASTALAAVALVAVLPQISQPPVPDVVDLFSPTIETAPATPAPAREAAQDCDPGCDAPVPAPTPAPVLVAPASPRVSGDAAALVGGALVGGVLAMEQPTSRLRKRTLSGLARMQDAAPRVHLSTEAFPEADANPLKITAEDPVSTFSIDVDTASYSVVRSSLMRGHLPPEGAVRIEEMINYFPYNYPAPAADGAPFQSTVSVGDTPWNPDTRLVHIALQGQVAETENRPPLNLVFLIDTSGSMNQANKLPLLRQSLGLMLGQLSAQDSVAIVSYAGSAGQVLAPTSAGERGTILAALDGLQAGGSTAGQAGLQQAYALARSMSDDGEVSRVLLATDGDFNVGLSDPDALKTYIARQRDSGVYLSVLGFGRGNLDDATMQALAQNGNGQAAYIDTLGEAQKVLVDQLTGALFPIADDVKIQVEFNPAKVAEYRLIGYETRALRREDFNNDKVDAGEIGAGHSVTALYEITPVGSPARLSDPLRFQAAATGDPDGALGYLKLRYKSPGADKSQVLETPIVAAQTPGRDAQFAMAIAGFGQLLTGATYLGDWGWDQAIALANATRGDDDYGYRREAVQLMRLAQSLSAR